MNTQAKRRGARVPATRTPVDRSASDADLVAACLDGRRDAFDLIVERHRRVVYQVCYRFSGNHEDAADLAQESFVRAWRGLARFRGDASLSTWLYRIAVNASLSRAGARPPGESLDVLDQVAGHEPAPDTAVLRAQEAARVRRAVARLPPKQRATLVLRIYHDLSHEEIARILGKSVGTVKANLFFALRNLRARLGAAGV